MIRGIQIIGVIIGLFLIYQSYRMVHNKENEDVPEFLLWTTIGVVIAVVAAFPDSVSYALGITDMSNRVYLLLTGGVLLLFIMLVRSFRMIKELESQLSRLNEELSILRYEGRKNK